MEYLSNAYADLLSVAEQNKENYAQAKPFPSISFPNVFNSEFLSAVVNEFPDLASGDAIQFNDAKQKKLAGKGEKRFGPRTKEFMHFLNSEPVLEFLQVLTGIEEKLIPDPYFYGGGLHEIKKGGLLKVHADFNKHPVLKLDRRINLLVYLNKDWKEEYGGHFELWDTNMEKCERKILPLFNTIAIFSTTDFSYHGHPNPLNCPDGRSRKSLALYYYTNGRPQHEINSGLEAHNTLFKARKGDEADKRAFEEPLEEKNVYGLKELVKDFTPPLAIKLIKKIIGK
ncbi:MAG: 2OG-Fe(II) oxygenase [Bacteroidia bacterium]